MGQDRAEDGSVAPEVQLLGGRGGYGMEKVKRVWAFLTKERRGRWDKPVVVVAISTVAFIGGFLGFVAVNVYAVECPPSAKDPICVATRESFPWTALSGLIAAPALILTWYWRTTHKKADIRNVRSPRILRPGVSATLCKPAGTSDRRLGSSVEARR